MSRRMRTEFIFTHRFDILNALFEQMGLLNFISHK